MNTNTARLILFYSVFLLLLLIYCLLCVTFYVGLTPITVKTLSIISASAPVITGDISLFGEYTPPVLAGLMAATAPPKSARIPFYVALFLSGACYALYVHLTIFMRSEAAEVIIGLAEIEDAGLVQTFVTSVRTFSIVVGAALLGLRLNNN